MKVLKLFLMVTTVFVLLLPQVADAARPRIVSFKAISGTVTPDGSVTLNWETVGLPYVWLRWSRRSPSPGDEPSVLFEPPDTHIIQYVHEELLPSSGSLTIPVSELAVFPETSLPRSVGQLYFTLQAAAQPDRYASTLDFRMLFVYVDSGIKIRYFKIGPSTLRHPCETLTFSWSILGASHVYLEILSWPCDHCFSKRLYSTLSNLPNVGTFSLVVTPEIFKDAYIQSPRGSNVLSWQFVLHAYSSTYPDTSIQWRGAVQVNGNLKKQPYLCSSGNN